VNQRQVLAKKLFQTDCDKPKLVLSQFLVRMYVYFRSTEEIFALFISMAFAVDAFKDVVCGKTVYLRISAYCHPMTGTI